MFCSFIFFSVCNRLQSSIGIIGKIIVHFTDQSSIIIVYNIVIFSNFDQSFSIFILIICTEGSMIVVNLYDISIQIITKFYIVGKFKTICIQNFQMTSSFSYYLLSLDIVYFVVVVMFVVALFNLQKRKKALKFGLLPKVYCLGCCLGSSLDYCLG